MTDVSLDYNQPSKPIILGLILTLLLIIMSLSRGLPPLKVLHIDIFRIWSVIILGISSAFIILRFSKRITIDMNVIIFSIFTVYVSLSLAWTITPFRGLSRLFTLFEAATLIFAGITFVTTRRRFNAIIVIVLGVGAATMCIAAWELMTGSHLPASRLSLSKFYAPDAATAVFYNRNDFSFYLSLLIPIGVKTGLDARRLLSRLLGILFVIAAMGIIWTNGSRSSLIAGITGIVLVSIGTVLRSKLNRLSTIPRIGVLTYAGIALASFLIPLLFNNPFSIPDQGSLHTRYRLLEIGVRNAAEYPLGTGLGGFPEVIANSPLRPERVRTPHSWAIQLLVELGVPGVLLFICLFGRVTDQLLYQTICGDNWMALPLATILLITPVSSIGPSESLYMPELWLVLALGLIYQIRSTQGWPGE